MICVFIAVPCVRIKFLAREPRPLIFERVISEACCLLPMLPREIFATIRFFLPAVSLCCPVVHGGSL